MIGKSVLSYDQNEFQLRHCRENTVMPGLAAFAARREITAMLVIAGKAEAHRDDGKA
ncbi:hypothetical protein D3C80_1914250 [compost metagenome]